MIVVILAVLIGVCFTFAFAGLYAQNARIEQNSRDICRIALTIAKNDVVFAQALKTAIANHGISCG